MKRLEAICSLISECEVFADIGCDHGFISQYVLENNLAEKVIASDISEKCLRKAQCLLDKYQNVEFVCADGLEGINADVAAIGGMGGKTIIEILEKKFKTKHANDRPTEFILQPQDHACDLRSFLIANGYRIDSDFLAKENEKYYDIMHAKIGEQKLDEFQISLGAFYKASGESQQLLTERLLKEYQKFTTYDDGGKNDAKRDFLRQALAELAR